MRATKKFLSLSMADKRLLVNAWWLSVYSRTALWVLPFRVVIRLFRRSRRDHSFVGPAGRPDLERLVWAMTVASRFVPGTTCLTRALAANALCRRADYDTRIQIGVAKVDGVLKSHAWLEFEGETVLGELPDLESYKPLVTLEESGTPEGPPMPR